MDDPVKDEKMVRGELLSFDELFKPLRVQYAFP